MRNQNRAISSFQTITLYSVIDAVGDVLGIASPEPGAILYEASEKLVEGTYGVYEYIYMIGKFSLFSVETLSARHDLIFIIYIFAEGQMEKAVQQCLMAAAHQFDAVLQKKMLRVRVI